MGIWRGAAWSELFEYLSLMSSLQFGLRSRTHLTLLKILSKGQKSSWILKTKWRNSSLNSQEVFPSFFGCTVFFVLSRCYLFDNTCLVYNFKIIVLHFLIYAPLQFFYETVLKLSFHEVKTAIFILCYRFM